MEPILRHQEDMEWLAIQRHDRLFQQSLISPEEVEVLLGDQLTICPAGDAIAAPAE